MYLLRKYTTPTISRNALANIFALKSRKTFFCTNKQAVNFTNSTLLRDVHFKLSFRRTKYVYTIKQRLCACNSLLVKNIASYNYYKRIQPQT